MAINIECSKCHEKNSLKKKDCRKCGNNLRKDRHKSYWIDFLENGERKREKVGPSREAAEYRLGEVRKHRAEGRIIQRDPAADLSLGELFDWYLNYSEVKKLKSYVRYQEKISSIRAIVNTSIKVSNLNYGTVEEYVRVRSDQCSKARIGQKIAPKTVREEIATFRSAINLAIKYSKIRESPIKVWPHIEVENKRDRILTESEFLSLKQVTPPFMWRIIYIAYYTGMRQSEILKIEWNQIDLEDKWIRLRANQTKSNKARSVAFNDSVQKMLEDMPRHPTSNKVFLSSRNKPLERFTTYLREVFDGSLQRAGIENFLFHDLRHTYITNMIRAGHPEYAIMKQVGHTTTTMLRRYQLIDESDLRCLQSTG